MDTRYRLKKNLPFAKVGEIFRQTFDENDNNNVYMLQEAYSIKQHKIFFEDINNFDEWFEEIEEPKIYFTIDIYRSKFKEINTDYYSGWSALEVKNIKDLGLLFKTVEKTKKYLEYLKAKEIIKQDTKGFKPDWENPSQKRFFGYFNMIDKTLCHFNIGENRESKIFFGSEEDIKESFKKHPKEWKAYLTYEQ